MKITKRQLIKIIRESLNTNLEAGYPSKIDNFKYIPAIHWDESSLRQEYNEEVYSSFYHDGSQGIETSEEYLKSRWPDVDVAKLNFMTNEDEFIRMASIAPIVNLPIATMKTIHNHGQVHDIIATYELGKSSEQIKKDNYKFFSQHKTAADAGGKVHNKGDSYLRWVDRFANENIKPFDKPPILLNHNGRLMHIGGQTRQAGALTNKKILPYLILTT